MSERYEIRTTMVDGRVTLREVMFMGCKVGNITKKELANLVAQGAFSLCEYEDHVSYLKQLGAANEQS